MVKKKSNIYKDIMKSREYLPTPTFHADVTTVSSFLYISPKICSAFKIRNTHRGT